MSVRGRQSGVDLKPPQAAVVKSDGGERCGKVGTGFRQARLREASASEPLQKCRNRIRRCQNRGLTRRDAVHAASQTMPRADQPPSGLILPARITLPHFSVSSTMSLPKAVGEPISGVSPKSVRCAFSFGVARPALISALSLSTTCVGVFLGAPMPNHELT